MAAEVIDWLHHIGASLGAIASGGSGYVLARFKKVEEDAKAALRLAQTLRRELDRMSGEDRAERAAEARISRPDFLGVEDFSRRIDEANRRVATLERLVETERSQRHALGLEFHDYMREEAGKWTELWKDVALLKGMLQARQNRL
jgi:hypothetical protein